MPTQRRALIIGNGSITDYERMQEYTTDIDLVICCDGGLSHAERLGIAPDVAIGDFDSVDVDVLRFYESKSVELASYPADKDYTDMELGLVHAAEHGATSAVVLGGSGTRLDHTLANIYLLKTGLDLGVDVMMVDEHNEIRLTDGSICIHGQPGDIVSLLPISGNVSGVRTSGLKFPLSDADIKTGQTLSVSNVMTDNIAEVKIKSGLLLVIKAWD